MFDVVVSAFEGHGVANNLLVGILKSAPMSENIHIILIRDYKTIALVVNTITHNSRRHGGRVTHTTLRPNSAAITKRTVANGSG